MRGFFTKTLGALGIFAAMSAAIISPTFSPAQTISQPANPDTMFCAVQGSVATRLANRWQCLTPGTNGQVLKSGGPGANVGWQTLSGTGTVTSVDMTVPSFLAVSGNPITTAGTLAVTAPSATANFVLAAPNGVAGSPSMRALVGADIPAINLAGTGNGGITGTLPLTNIPTVTVAKGGTNATSASGTALDNITGFSGTGILRRTGAGTYTQGTTVSVAEGGTGATSASGTALDNITGFASTGVMSRTGAGTYSFSTIPALLGSQTANTFFAAPNGSAGNPSFRAIASADIPTSVALAGSPTTTTQAANDNSTKIATTAYVDAAVGTLPGGPTFVATTADSVQTSTTFSLDPNLTFSMAASTRYWVKLDIGVTASQAVGGVKVGYNLSNAVTASSGTCSLMAGTGVSGSHATATGAGTVSVLGAATSGAGVAGMITCVFEIENITANATFTIAFAQNSANGSTTYYKGGILSYKAY